MRADWRRRCKSGVVGCVRMFKITLQQELCMYILNHAKEARKPAPARAKPRALGAALAPLMVAAPMALSGCGENCSPPSGCDTTDYDITLRQGETLDTYSKGTPIHITASEIVTTVEPDGPATCRVTGGSAKITIVFETDPPYTMADLPVGPSQCQQVPTFCTQSGPAAPAATATDASTDIGTDEGSAGSASAPLASCSAPLNFCMAINDAEVRQDIGRLDAESGTCEVTNERLLFTLELAR
jgi:hypothetical protein